MSVDNDTLIAIAVSERAMVRDRVGRHVRGEIAEDLTQDVLAKAVELLRAGRLVVEEGTDVRGAVRAWLTAVLYWMVLNFYQRKKEPTEHAIEADVDNFGTPDPVHRDRRTAPRDREGPLDPRRHRGEHPPRGAQGAQEAPSKGAVSHAPRPHEDRQHDHLWRLPLRTEN